MNAVLAVNGWPYVAGAWLVTVAAVGGYTVTLLRRARRLSRQVAPQDRRWM